MLNKLVRVTLTDQVIQSLIDYIHIQKLMPGDTLPSESILAAEFGVSRPIIREAMKTLVGKDIIGIVNGKGAVVNPLGTAPLFTYFEHALHLDEDTSIYLMEVRRGLEMQSAYLAAERRTDEELEAMNSIVKAMGENIDDAAIYSDLDVQLHLMIASSARNLILVNLIESIRDALRDIFTEAMVRRRKLGEQKRVHGFHLELVDAIKRRNSKEASQIMATHVDEAIRVLQMGIEEDS